MAATLPMRVKQHLRDQITAPTSPVATKTLSVQKTLGYPISLDPEWTMLWKTLQAHFPEPATFVPYIANVLIAWCDGFVIWLEGEENEENVEKLLEGIRGGRVVLCLEISPSSKRPTTAWNPVNAAFIINLPNAAPVQTHTILSGFSTDFQNLFSASPTFQPTDPPKAAEEKDPDSWAHLSLDSPETHPIRTPISKPNSAGDDFLPELSTIQRPEELLKRPPYWLVVRQEGRNRVTVHGSHAASLGLLEGYLKKWCRGEVGLVDRPPIVTVRLQESAFGLGLLNDSLTLDTNSNRGREVSAMLILVFVENVLGYEALPMNGSAGSVWEFKRTRGFK